MEGDFHFVPKDEVDLHVVDSIYCMCDVCIVPAVELVQGDYCGETVWLHRPFSPIDNGKECIVFQE